jgi:uncharacterized membrane protein YuzA (DUF378 family)
MNVASAGSSGLSEPVQTQWSALTDLRDNVPRVIVRGSEIQLRFSEAGWDPYEVWSTRVRATREEVDGRALVLSDRLDSEIARPEIHTPNIATFHRTAGFAVVWPALMLAIILGLNRGLVGIFGFDLVALVFGVMTPAARAVHVLLGISAIYCAIAVVMFGVTQPGRMRPKQPPMSAAQR